MAAEIAAGPPPIGDEDGHPDVREVELMHQEGQQQDLVLQLDGREREQFNIFHEMADIIWGNLAHEPESFGMMLYTRFAFLRGRSPVVNALFTVWMLALFTAGSLHVPGLIYVLFTLVPVVCSWYPSAGDLEDF